MSSYVVSPSGVVLKPGFVVLVHLDDGGVFTGTVKNFEADGAVVVIEPRHNLVQDVFPLGYRLGQAHWKSGLTIVAEDPW